ncbi:hypothetical protein BDV96DRAFT_134213 [Lophiotrema nucula]|uniref:NACHT domain-containing protein n=1 Tax=Lophiotrema nucula TaxID=690887 RepID=A0A6A5ZSX0_9PLEO|nr:hypothetical protein BDV96DRAFT_134213 [Lophiotrema nucula]
MDPLSVAASIITIVQVANAITIICLDASSKSNSARLNIRRILDDVNSLRTVLEGLACLVADGHEKSATDLPNLQALATKDGPLSRCKTELEELQAELQKAVNTKTGMITWIFREKEVNARLERVSRVRQSLQLALTTDQTTIILDSRIVSMVIRSTLDDTVAENQRESILQWLGAASSSSNLNDAQKLRTPTTGDWLLRGSAYAQWKISPRSLFWLHGVPGSGKTVLCSSIVEDLKEMSIYNSDMLVLYVFFDFSRQGQQVLSTFLRSLLAQILVQKDDIPEAILSLYQRHHKGFNQAGDQALLDTLQVVLKDVRPTYLVMDALDECAERADLLRSVRDIVNWKFEHLHVLATSRPEMDIDETFLCLGAHRLSLEDEIVRDDIRQYVEATVCGDNRLKKWPDEVQSEITTVIMSKAGTMFRWVACQLEVLKNCMNLKRLREALQALPSTLDETYARILKNVDPHLSRDALRVLSFLCFSAEEVTVEEIADVLAIDPETNEYDVEMRIQNPADILRICGSLVTRRPTGTFNLSHYTVKEFLTSGRILQSSLKHFHIRERTAETMIAKASLIYLAFYDQQRKGPPSSRHVHFLSPFTHYALNHWVAHFSRAANVSELLPFVIQLLYRGGSGFLHWGMLAGDGRNRFHIETPQLSLSARDDIVLYLATLMSCPELVDVALKRGANINGLGGEHGTALNVAALSGKKSFLELLFDRGADVNVQSGVYGSALQAAAAFGQLDIMSSLISRGADVNASGGIYGAPILAAMYSEDNCAETVELLMNAGCNLRIPGRYAGNPSSEGFISLLSVAAHYGIEPVVRLLLERNVDPNEDNAAALQFALDESQTDIADILISKGAMVNFSGGAFHSTIGAAVSGGIFSTQFLIDTHNADLTIRDIQGRTALHLASGGTSTYVVEYLLELGMDVNDKDTRGWTSLHYAAMSYDTKILELLIPHWNNHHTSQNSQWTPLHLACCYNEPHALDLLINMGFEPIVITTTEGQWTLYDIAVAFRNERLVAQDGIPLHPLLTAAKAGCSVDRTVKSIHDAMPKHTGRVCDGCSPFMNKPIYGPVFHCKECHDFDYCFMCMHNGQETHPHSSWLVATDGYYRTIRQTQELNNALRKLE